MSWLSQGQFHSLSQIVLFQHRKALMARMTLLTSRLQAFLCGEVAKNWQSLVPMALSWPNLSSQWAFSYCLILSPISHKKARTFSPPWKPRKRLLNVTNSWHKSWHDTLAFKLFLHLKSSPLHGGGGAGAEEEGSVPRHPFPGAKQFPPGNPQSAIPCGKPKCPPG